MVKLFIATLLLVVSLVNAANAGVSEFFSETYGGNSCVGFSTEEKSDGVSAHSASTDCHRSDCTHEGHAATHHCHVGHCQFVATVNSLSLFAPNFTLASGLGRNSTLQSILPSAPIKPPRA